MAFIETIPEEQADGAAAAQYAAERERLGYLPNYVTAFGAAPEVFAAWRALNGAIKAAMDERRYELVTVAAARALGSSYCALAHGRILAQGLLDGPTARTVLVDGAVDRLDPAEAAAMRLAEAVAEDAGRVTQADVDELRALGLSDADVVHVVLAAAARCFFSKTLDALGVQADAAFQAMDAEMREALTVGRPVATA
jgi:uncharacterized peroxidase-related enzyme